MDSNQTPPVNPPNPPAPEAETPVPPPTTPPTPSALPTEPTASVTPPVDEHPAPPPPTPEQPIVEEKKGPPKGLLVIGGLLVVGALSAVFLVSNMKTGSTQNYAAEPTKVPPPPPTAAPAPVIKDKDITLTSPVDHSTVTTPTVMIMGKTFPNADVSVDDGDTTADSNGDFSGMVTLDEGDNDIDVIANDAAGNYAEEEITVTYEPQSQ